MLAALSAEPNTLVYGEIAVEGGALRLAMAGEGPPLILLHGWTLDHRMWTPQIAELAQHFLLVMPDRRGCGRSTAPPDLMCEARDLIAIADFLGFSRFAVLGLSQGATVALDAARQYASRMTALVVSGAPLPALVPREEVIDLEAYHNWVAAGDLAMMRKEWSLHPLMQAHSREAHLLLTGMLADYDGRDLMKPSDPPSLSCEVLSELEVPVLALTGEHDTPWRRACAGALARTAPRAMHALVPQAGHLANADNPAHFNGLVSAFLHNLTATVTRPNP